MKALPPSSPSPVEPPPAPADDMSPDDGTARQKSRRQAALSATWRTWRFLGVAHVASLFIFVGTMAAFIWYEKVIEGEERQNLLQRDTDWARQSIELSLQELQVQLSRLAPIWLQSAAGSAPLPASQNLTPKGFFERFAPVRYIGLIDGEGRLESVSLADGVLASNALEAGEITQGQQPSVLTGFGQNGDKGSRWSTLQASLHSWQPEYSPPLMIPGGEVVTELYLPVIQGRQVVTTAVVGISLEQLLQSAAPGNILERYRLTIQDESSTALATITSDDHQADMRTTQTVPLTPPGQGLALNAIGYDAGGTGFTHRLSTLGLLTLSLTLIISLILLWRSARDRLRIENERDRLFLLSQDVFCVVRPDGTLVRGNPAFVEYFGKDTANTRFWDHVYPDDRLDVIEAFTSNDDAERIGPLECRVRFRSAWRWLSWSISVDRSSSESLYYAVAHDITTRKHIEHALTTETSFRRAIEDSISTGMRVIDNEGRITYVNRALCEMVGFEAEELIGQLPPYPYWIPEEYDLNFTHLNLTISGAAPPSGIQTRVRRKDGRIIDIRLYVSPLIDDQGQQAGWMASATDITEPNRIRDELVSAHERFNTVLNELGAAVSVASVPGARPDTPAPEGELLMPITRPSQTPTLLFSNFRYRALFGEDIAGHLALLKGWPVADAWIGEEVHVPSIDRWFEVRVQQIRWVDGQPAQLVVATDITALRPIWEQEKQQQEQLAQTSRLVTMGEMASSIAHELNQPLAAISNYAMGLAKRLQMQQARSAPPADAVPPTGEGNQPPAPASLPLPTHAADPGNAATGVTGNTPASPPQPAMRTVSPEQINETLIKIARQAQRAASVIQRVREFVRRSTPEQREVTVNAILTEALGLAEIAAKRHGVNISIQVQPTMPTIFADSILIEQVLLNLLKNAIDAMREMSRPALTLSVASRDSFVEFAVADQGPGLPEDMRERVFEAFFTTKREGMGMGLNICRSIIESHGGRLWVEANEPRGCVFRFTLPAMQREQSRGAAA
ncbi:MAG: PAS domain S-box protein [Lautropia sp.]|nr:PAS domain S-box protein [Lautropia sp.]